MADTAEKADLVVKVKEFQRQSYAHKENWYAFVHSKGKTDYDPNRHEPDILDEFLASMSSSPDGGVLSKTAETAASPAAWGATQPDDSAANGGGGGGGCFDWPELTGTGGGANDYQSVGKGCWPAAGGMPAGIGGGYDAGYSAPSWSSAAAGLQNGLQNQAAVSQMMQQWANQIWNPAQQQVAFQAASWEQPSSAGGGYGGYGGGSSGCGGNHRASNPRPGDWICPGCQNVNFSHRNQCGKCGTSSQGQQRVGMRPGDWICPSCGDLVFASKSACKMCQTPKPAGGGDGGNGGGYEAHGAGRTGASRASPY